MKKEVDLILYILFNILIITGVNAQTYKTSWLGNTYGYADGQWVQNCITSLYVAPNGRCYTNSIWDEGHHETGIYSTDGAVLGSLFETQGLAITGDGTDIYVTQGNNPTSYLRKFQGSNTALRLWNVQVTGNTKLYDMVAKNGKIYATDPNNNQVIIYNTSDGSEAGTFPVTRPSEITIDNSGYLWIVQSAYSYAGNIPFPNPYIAAPKILRYSTAGVKQSQEITDVVEPTDIAMDNNGRLIVAENGPDLQVRYYKNITTSPVIDTTFGQQGGIYSGVRGEIQDTKFYKLNGLGMDQNSNLYICLSGPNPKGDNPLYDTDLRKFNSSGQLQWKLLGKEFVDMGDLDPDDPTKYYTKDSRYTLNWNNMNAGSEWSYAAFIIDPWRYPNDPRGAVKGTCGFSGSPIENVFVRRIGGQKFMYGNSMSGGQGNLWIWRFNSSTDGEIAIPCGCIGNGLSAPNCPYSGEWIWRDLNGNGQCEANEYTLDPVDEYPYCNGKWPDKDGNVWRSYRDVSTNNIRKLVCSGLDANGIPQYSFTPRTTWSKPSVFQDVHYLRYLPETDCMYVAGWPKDSLPTGDQPEGVRCIAKYNNWSTNPTLVWKSNRLDYPELISGMSFDVAGDYIFVAYRGDNDQTTDPKNGTVYIYKTSDGSRYSKIEAGPEVGGACGLIDIWDSGIRASQRPGTNEYLIFLEEDGKAKTIIYRWYPDGDFILPDFSIQLTSPRPDSTYFNTDDVIFEATVKAGSSTISKVEFYADDVKIGEDLSSPYTFVWSKPTVGTHAIYAKATDQNGKTNKTNYFGLKIVDGNPIISLQSPSSGINYSILDTIVFSATALDYNGSIQKVEFFSNGTSIGAISNSPYSLTWNKPQPGQYEIFAKATDNEGNSTITPTVTVNISDQFDIPFNFPVRDTILSEGARFNIQLNTDSIHHNFKSITYYNGGSLLNISTTTPYLFSVTNANGGAYNLSAVITLNDDRQMRTMGSTVFVMSSAFDCAHTGMMNMDFWNGVDGTTVNLIPLGILPSVSKMANIFEGSTNIGSSYGERMCGYICPPQTGLYTFWTSGDDNNQLRIKLPEADTLKTIAFVNNFTGIRAWDWYPSQKSEPIMLQSGQMYLVEGLLKQGSGSDNFAVGWQLPDSTLERPIPGNRLIPLYNPLTFKDDVSIKITSPIEGAIINTMDSITIVAEVQNGLSDISYMNFYSSALRMIGTDKTPETNNFTFKTKLNAGTYKLTAKGIYKELITVPSNTVNITVKNITAVDDIYSSNVGFEVSPNPLSTGSLSIKLPIGATQLSVFDVTGKIVYQEIVTKNEYLIDQSVFKSSGVYIVKVLTTNNSMNKKVIVTR